MRRTYDLSEPRYRHKFHSYRKTKMLMKGLSWQSLKANYSLIPLFSVVALGMALAAGHSFRCLAFSNDVKVNRRSLDHPWEGQESANGTFKHTKYYQINDYRQIKKNEYEPALKQ